MHTFETSINALRAARTHAPDKDVRYYLPGVHFDLDAGRMVATDGHRAFICAGPAVPGAGTFIMPNDLIDSVLKAVGKRPLYDTVEVSLAAGTIQVKTANGTFSAPAVDGRFPDWRRIVPQSVSGEVAQFNPQYLADAREALATYQGFKTDKVAFEVAHNGTNPCVCTSICDDALVIVMPMRDTGAADAASRAAWVVSMAARDAAAAAVEAA
jgi:DNA polymerase-3 subunit beta